MSEADGVNINKRPSIFCCCKCSKEPHSLNMTPYLDLGDEEYEVVVENLCVFNVPRYLLLLEEEVKGHPEDNLPLSEAQSVASEWKPPDTVISYFAGTSSQLCSDMESARTTRTYYDMVPKLTQDDCQAVQTTVLSPTVAQSSTYFDVALKQHQGRKGDKKSFFPYVSEEVEIYQALNVPHKVELPKEIDKKFSDAQGGPTCSMTVVPRQESPSSEARPDIVWRSQGVVQQCMLETSPFHTIIPRPKNIKAAQITVIDEDRSSYFDMVPKLQKRYKSKDLESKRPQDEPKISNSRPTVGNPTTSTRIQHLQKEVPSELVLLNNLDSRLVGEASTVGSRNEAPSLVYRTHCPVVPHTHAQVHRRYSSAEKSLPQEQLVREPDAVQVMRYYSRSKSKLFPRVPPPDFVSMGKGRLIPATAEERRQLNAYLNQFSAVLTHNLKDPIPKDTDSFPRESTKWPLAESISQVGASKYQTLQDNVLPSQKVESKADKSYRLPPSSTREQPRGYEKSQINQSQVDDSRLASSQRDLLTSSSRREHGRETSTVPHYSSSRRNDAPLESAISSRRGNETSRATLIRPNYEYKANIWPSPPYEPQTVAAPQASSRKSYERTRPVSSRSDYEHQSKASARSEYDRLETAMAPIMSSRREYGTTRATSSRQQYETSRPTSSRIVHDRLTEESRSSSKPVYERQTVPSVSHTSSRRGYDQQTETLYPTDYGRSADRRTRPIELQSVYPQPQRYQASRAQPPCQQAVRYLHTRKVESSSSSSLSEDSNE